MSRAFTRVLVLSAIGGLAAAPALAYAAGGDGPAPHTPTVTKVMAPKQAHAGENFLLSARVVLAKGPTAPVTDPPPGQQPKDSATGKGGKGKGGSTGKKGKGGKGHEHRHPRESGQMTFVIDGKALTPVKVSQGRALEKLELPAGTHTATASYSGDRTYNPSQSAPVTFTVS